LKAGRCVCVFCIFACVACISLVGCRGRGGANKAEWIAWFDSTAATLPRLESPPHSPDGAVRTHPADGLLLRLDSAYRQRNDYVCWNKYGGQPAILLKDVCVQRLVPERYPHPRFMLKAQEAEPGASDQYRREGWQAGSVVLNKRQAIVETSILLELRRGEWVLLQGTASDDSSPEEFLQIASTIEPAKAK
jgi:hypothetical protein